MSQVIFISHLPNLRMRREEDFQIASGCLTKLPWDQFDDLTQGAFTDWRQRYIDTDPIFFWYQEEADFPFVKPGNAEAMAEMKLPQSTQNDKLSRLGLDFINVFHDKLVNPVWAAAALAAPASLSPEPRSSVTFCMPAGDNHLEVANLIANGVRVQGDSDQELVYLADGVSEEFDDALLEQWAQLVPVARYALEDANLAPAMQLLLGASDLSLTDHERVLLAVAALESLLIPDIKVGSGKTFARRLSNLLGVSASHQALLNKTALTLYRYRSAVIHAQQEKADRIELPPASAEQLLAGAIINVSLHLAQQTSIDAIRCQLDDTQLANKSLKQLPLQEPPGLASDCRLGPRKAWWAATVSVGASLASQPGTINYYAPLIGLHRSTSQGKGIASHQGMGVSLLTMNANDIVSMEEKDIRRDFISNIRGGTAITALGLTAPHAGGMVEDAHVKPLSRARNLIVVGLRLNRLVTFIDPQLLGWYIYEGNIRHRKETVLRQSILIASQSDHSESLDAVLPDALNDTWNILAKYDSDARDIQIDRVLGLFRRIHDRHHLPVKTRASLAIICVESLLGRFAKRTAAVQLEDLVATLDNVDETSVNWFQSEGRSFRNTVAHGKWSPQIIEGSEVWHRDYEPIQHLQEISRAAVSTLLATWVTVDPPVRARHGSQKLLVRTLRKRVDIGG